MVRTALTIAVAFVCASTAAEIAPSAKPFERFDGCVLTPEGVYRCCPAKTFYDSDPLAQSVWTDALLCVRVHRRRQRPYAGWNEYDPNSVVLIRWLSQDT